MADTDGNFKRVGVKEVRVAAEVMEPVKQSWFRKNFNFNLNLTAKLRLQPVQPCSPILIDDGGQGWNKMNSFSTQQQKGSLNVTLAPHLLVTEPFNVNGLIQTQSDIGTSIWSGSGTGTGTTTGGGRRAATIDLDMTLAELYPPGIVDGYIRIVSTGRVAGWGRVRFPRNSYDTINIHIGPHTHTRPLTKYT